MAIFSKRSFLRAGIGCALGFGLVNLAHAQATSLSNTPRPVANANALSSEPVIDGDVLNDPAWQNAEPITDLIQIQPNSGQNATQRTEVFVGYTNEAIYIGVIAHDTNPELIIATDSRRDSSLTDTDAIRIMIDGLLDRQNGFVFGTKPAGVEYDGQVTREGAGQCISGGEGGFNLNWDAPWTVNSQIGDYGWSTEMRIPFSTLRYGSAEEQSWGFNVERRIRSNNEIVYWAPMSQDRDILRVWEGG